MKPVPYLLKCTDNDQAYHYDGLQRITFGRSEDNTHQLFGQRISRHHCYLEVQDGNLVLFDTSINGVLVNDRRVDGKMTLRNGARLQIGSHNFIFISDIDSLNDEETIVENLENKLAIDKYSNHSKVLKVTISGGGPVGLSFALLLENLLNDRVLIKVYDGRWNRQDSRVVWKSESERNARRQQVVTIQSRQYLKLPEDVQNRVFQEGCYSQMWPLGSDSIEGHGPRNVRIAHLEDQLLAIANEKSERIQLIPARFNIKDRYNDTEDQHILAICEGSQSRTREFFIEKFGNAEKAIYTLEGNHLQDVVLGLRVKSDLPDTMAVLLAVAQNRFLFNSLNGDGFLNVRLTDEEVKEVVGIDLHNKEFRDCIQSQPCLMERAGESEQFGCATHSTLFLPAILKGSALWSRILEGLKLFAVRLENLSAVTVFRLNLVQRPRFTVQLYPPKPWTPGTYGCLLGDAANAVHFWSGRGLNSGISSAVSLARCLTYNWKERPFRDADFLRHEALMSMLQYRHKSRAWRSMVATDRDGKLCAIKDKIRQGLIDAQSGKINRDSELDELISRTTQIRSRLQRRISHLPDDTTLRDHLRKLNGETLKTLVASGPWDTYSVGGEEVDVDLLFEDPGSPPQRKAEKRELPDSETSSADRANKCNNKTDAPILHQEMADTN